MHPARAALACIVVTSICLLQIGCAASPRVEPQHPHAQSASANFEPTTRSSFRTDLVLHCVFSATLSASGYAVGRLLGAQRAEAAALGAATALSAGLAKEALDALGLGNPSWEDLGWDAIGTGIGLGVALPIDLAVSP